MFKMNRWTRSEKRSLCLGLTLAAAGACGAFQGLFDDAVHADVKSRRLQRSEIRQAAGVDAAAQQLEERMEAAMDEASSKLDQFVSVLKKPSANQADFAVKYLVVEGDEGEYLWLNEVQMVRKKFTGKVANHPQFAKSVKFGQTVSISEDEVDDWMYVENGKLKGGYTIRAQRETLKGEDRKKFDAQFKFKFE